MNRIEYLLLKLKYKDLIDLEPGSSFFVDQTYEVYYYSDASSLVFAISDPWEELYVVLLDHEKKLVNFITL